MSKKNKPQRILTRTFIDEGVWTKETIETIPGFSPEWYGMRAYHYTNDRKEVTDESFFPVPAWFVAEVFEEEGRTFKP